MTRVSPLRTYRCADCGGRVIRSKGGERYWHETPGSDHAPRVVER